jgi:phenylacetate-CoA ligase
VLLNYPIGDVGALSAADCPCGRSFGLLTELEGRVEDVLALDDGRFVHPRMVWQALKDDRDVLQYQLTQLAPRRFALALATLDDASFERARARVLPALGALLAPEPTIEVRRSRELERAAGGKFRAVASLVARPGVA